MTTAESFPPLWYYSYFIEYAATLHSALCFAAAGRVSNLTVYRCIERCAPRARSPSVALFPDVLTLFQLIPHTTIPHPMVRVGAMHGAAHFVSKVSYTKSGTRCDTAP